MQPLFHLDPIFTLIGIGVIVVGFLARLNPLLVVTAAWAAWTTKVLADGHRPNKPGGTNWRGRETGLAFFVPPQPLGYPS